MTTCRNLDVTPQILDNHRIYGASDNTNQQYTSSNRCLNYGNGNTIQKPELDRVSNIPREIHYQDSVGLFGAENHFVKINFKLQEPVTGTYAINGYNPAKTGVEIVVASDPYTYNNGCEQPGQVCIDLNKDPIILNTYEPALMSGESLLSLSSKYFKVELNNLKTGNIYIDCWLDVRLYNKNYDEHPYDIMYIKQGESFYIGFHARNTKRLPYNVNCIIGQESLDINLPAFGELGDFDNRYLATKQ